MINRRDKVALGLAIGFGLLAALLIHLYLQRQQPQMIRVMVAREDIPAGTTFSEDLLTARSVPRAGVNVREVITQAEFRVRKHIFETQESRVYIPQGVPVLRSFFSFEERTLAKAVPVGMRAITVRVDEASGVAYALEPGDHVDVVVAYPTMHGAMVEESKAPAARIRSEVLLEDLTILRTNDERPVTMSYDGTAEAPPRRYTSVTLAVTVDQAQRLVEAEQMGGRVTLVLRNPAEATAVPAPPSAQEKKAGGHSHE